MWLPQQSCYESLNPGRIASHQIRGDASPVSTVHGSDVCCHTKGPLPGHHAFMHNGSSDKAPHDSCNPRLTFRQAKVVRPGPMLAIHTGHHTTILGTITRGHHTTILAAMKGGPSHHHPGGNDKRPSHHHPGGNDKRATTPPYRQQSQDTIIPTMRTTTA